MNYLLLFFKRVPKRNRLVLLAFILFLVTTSCHATSPARISTAPSQPEIRFLLTFDDGPAIASPSPTAAVLDHLKKNPVESNVKAIFFVLTRAPKNGAAEEGRALMQREHSEDHILAIHSGTARGHLNHTSMKPEELQKSLSDGMDDIAGITGETPLFVRPPFWRYNADTLAMYENNGLNMMLSDVKAYDGGSSLLHLNSQLSSQRHGSMLSELQRVAEKIKLGEIPVVNGVMPIIVTFHDTSMFTANHLEEWLQILVEEARRAGLRVSSTPFYDNREELQTAALKRAEHRVLHETRLPARIVQFLKGGSNRQPVP